MVLVCLRSTIIRMTGSKNKKKAQTRSQIVLEEP